MSFSSTTDDNTTRYAPSTTMTEVTTPDAYEPGPLRQMSMNSVQQSHTWNQLPNNPNPYNQRMHPHTPNSAVTFNSSISSAVSWLNRGTPFVDSPPATPNDPSGGFDVNANPRNSTTSTYIGKSTIKDSGKSGETGPTSFKEIRRERHKSPGSIDIPHAGNGSSDAAQSTYSSEKSQSTATIRPPSGQPSETSLKHAQYAQEHRDKNPAFVQMQQPPGPGSNGHPGSNGAPSQPPPPVKETHRSTYDTSFTQDPIANHKPASVVPPNPAPVARVRTRESSFAKPTYQDEKSRHSQDDQKKSPKKRRFWCC